MCTAHKRGHKSLAHLIAKGANVNAQFEVRRCPLSCCCVAARDVLAREVRVRLRAALLPHEPLRPRATRSAAAALGHPARM